MLSGLAASVEAAPLQTTHRLRLTFSMRRQECLDLCPGRICVRGAVASRDNGSLGVCKSGDRFQLFRGHTRYLFGGLTRELSQDRCHERVTAAGGLNHFNREAG
jgi:hypothetical protein